MDTPRNNPNETPNFDALVQECLTRWRALSQGRKDLRSIDEIIATFSLNPDDKLTLRTRFEEALAQEGYPREHLESIEETRRIITRAVLGEFITFSGISRPQEL